jgi:MoxR-like ATPase
MIKEVIAYPTEQDEVEVLNRIENHAFEKKPPVMTVKAIDMLQRITENVYIDDKIKQYIASIVTATRYPKNVLGDQMAGYIKMGASPRASIAFMRTAKARALLNGRTYVVPEDVKDMAHLVLRHRIALNYSAIAEKVKVEDIIDTITSKLRTP